MPSATENEDDELGQFSPGSPTQACTDSWKRATGREKELSDQPSTHRGYYTNPSGSSPKAIASPPPQVLPIIAPGLPETRKDPDHLKSFKQRNPKFYINLQGFLSKNRALLSRYDLNPSQADRSTPEQLATFLRRISPKLKVSLVSEIARILHYGGFLTPYRGDESIEESLDRNALATREMLLDEVLKTPDFDLIKFNSQKIDPDFKPEANTEGSQRSLFCIGPGPVTQLAPLSSLTHTWWGDFQPKGPLFDALLCHILNLANIVADIPHIIYLAISCQGIYERHHKSYIEETGVLCQKLISLVRASQEGNLGTIRIILIPALNPGLEAYKGLAYSHAHNELQKAADRFSPVVAELQSRWREAQGKQADLDFLLILPIENFLHKLKHVLHPQQIVRSQRNAWKIKYRSELVLALCHAFTLGLIQAEDNLSFPDLPSHCHEGGVHIPLDRGLPRQFLKLAQIYFSDDNVLPFPERPGPVRGTENPESGGPDIFDNTGISPSKPQPSVWPSPPMPSPRGERCFSPMLVQHPDTTNRSSRGNGLYPHQGYESPNPLRPNPLQLPLPVYPGRSVGRPQPGWGQDDHVGRGAHSPPEEIERSCGQRASRGCQNVPAITAPIPGTCQMFLAEWHHGSRDQSWDPFHEWHHGSRDQSWGPFHEQERFNSVTRWSSQFRTHSWGPPQDHREGSSGSDRNYKSRAQLWGPDRNPQIRGPDPKRRRKENGPR